MPASYPLPAHLGLSLGLSAWEVEWSQVLLSLMAVLQGPHQNVSHRHILFGWLQRGKRVISSVCLCHDSSDSSFFVLSLTVLPPASVFIF